MNTWKSLVFGCALALLVLPLVVVSDASAQNLLANPRFETGDLTGWESFGLSPSSIITVESPDNGDGLPGTHNVFLDNQAQALALGIKQSTPAGSAGPGIYNYAFDVKLAEAGVGAVFFVEIFAEAEAGGVVGQTLLGPFFPAEWTTYQGTFTAPANTSFLTFQFAAITGAVEGSVSSYHVDNAYIGVDVPVPAEPTNWGDMKSLYR